MNRTPFLDEADQPSLPVTHSIAETPFLETADQDPEIQSGEREPIAETLETDRWNVDVPSAESRMAAGGEDRRSEDAGANGLSLPRDAMPTETEIDEEADETGLFETHRTDATERPDVFEEEDELTVEEAESRPSESGQQPSATSQLRPTVTSQMAYAHAGETDGNGPGMMQLEGLAEALEQASEDVVQSTVQREDPITGIVRGVRLAFTQSPPSARADASAAVPPLNFFKRLAMPVPLLDASRNARAVSWNQTAHPSTSRIDPNDIRTDLARYVNLAAIEGAIRLANGRSPSSPIAMGTPPIDAVFVEAVHQFQAKCFFETAQIDGLAGESTLDSLGLVRRDGMNTVDRRNAAALSRLRDPRVDVPGLAGKEFTADTWFDFMVNPSFLGWRFTSGVHVVLIRRLRQAEIALLSQPTYAGLTPVELGRALGFDERSEQHRGARPNSATASMHAYGLAVDVLYAQNPWVRGSGFTNALKRSARLMSGVSISQGTSQEFFASIGSDPNLTTEDQFDQVSRRNQDFKRYLRLQGDIAALSNVLQQRRNDGTPGVFSSSETLEQASRRWDGLIAQDLANMRSTSSPFRTSEGGLRDPLDGFLNFNKDLVVALRDKACLAWGAVDFGPRPGGSGDVMHFDARVCGLGDQLASVGGNARVRAGHRCVPCSET